MDTMHRINLKGPWDFRPVQGVPAETAEGRADAPLPTPGTVKFPADWQMILGDFRGTVNFTRRFNCPTNLEATDRVDLILDGVNGTAEIKLNQQPVGTVREPNHTARFDVTAALQLHNLLEITINWNGPTTELGGLWAPVALEITSAP